MSDLFRIEPRIVGAGFALALLAALASAQTATPGVQSREDAEAVRPAAPTPLVDPTKLAAPVASQATIRVNGFRFNGNRLIQTELLQHELREYSNRELTAAELHDAAAAIASFYVRHGHLARTRVRAVTPGEGIAEMTIEELRLGRIDIDSSGADPISPLMAERILTDHLQRGAPTDLAAIESGIALLNLQPGLAVAGGLDPGADRDEVDLTLRVRDRARISGSIRVDNHGLREIGQTQLIVDLRADHQFGRRERVGVQLVQSTGLSSVAPTISVPVGSDGLRIGVGASRFRYHAQRTGAALELAGSNTSWRTFVSRPMLFPGGLALIGDISLRGTEYHDDSIFGELRRRRIATLAGEMAGFWRNSGATNQFRIEVLAGHADLSGNAGDAAQDARSSRVDGRFSRLRWRLSREEAFGSGVIALRARGQWADRNLDATQKFYLGGADRVRAFATTEGLGDTAWLAGAEWRLPMTPTLETRAFMDTGAIRRNARPWFDQQNRYGLSGFGAGLVWRLPDAFRFDVELAGQWGGNPGRNADGTEADGRNSRWRLWLALSRSF